MPYCLRGIERTGRNQTGPAFYYFEGNSPPFVTYTANQADINYWGMNFVVIGYQAGSIYGPVMVSYTISQVAGPGECTSADPPPPPPSPRYDCINGSCLGQSQYGTPGIYESLSACEQNCGPGCGGVCISNSDWAKISSLAAMVKNKDCS
jgi:hypothetical protein